MVWTFGLEELPLLCLRLCVVLGLQVVGESGTHVFGLVHWKGVMSED